MQRAVSGGNAPCTGSGGTWLTTMSTYTPTGQLGSATDPSGNTTIYSYDVADRLQSVTNAAGKTTSNTAYDGDNRVLTVARGLLGQPPNPLSTLVTTEQRAYTPNGLLASRKEFQSPTVFNLTTYTPDGFDRPGVVGYQDGTNETFAYTVNDAQDYMLTRAAQPITQPSGIAK